VKKAKVGIIGFGTVGTGVASCLIENSSIIKARTGIDLILHKIADLDISRPRGIVLDKNILTTDVNSVLKESDIIVELIGGTTTAKKIIQKALQMGKPVVTANKALLAKYGNEIFALAEKMDTDIYYEASVAGGIPVIKSLREGLAANKIEKIYGILNGTCNYILTQMTQNNQSFEVALKKAQELGYAEAEPSLDIDGFDTAHKIVILASLAYGNWINPNCVYTEGIRNISLYDIKYAKDLGYTIKLFGIAKRMNDDIQVRVHPVMIPTGTIMASTNEANNGIFIEGKPVGGTLFYGKGAGMAATSSAVIADIIDIARNLKHRSNRRIPCFTTDKHYGRLLPMEEIGSRYYLRINVTDEPGVISKISTILGNEKISISSLIQWETSETSKPVPIVIVTHSTYEKNIMKALEKIQTLSIVHEKINLIRIEDLQ
jgi:homoserine dehydrogenase